MMEITLHHAQLQYGAKKTGIRNRSIAGKLLCRIM
jgi:hypothetical protein